MAASLTYTRLQAPTMTHSLAVFELQYALDAAYTINSEADLQHNMSVISDVYRSGGDV